MMMKFVCIIIWLPLSAEENVFLRKYSGSLGSKYAQMA